MSCCRWNRPTLRPRVHNFCGRVGPVSRQPRCSMHSEHLNSTRRDIEAPAKPVAHKIAGCVALSILVSLGTTACDQPALASAPGKVSVSRIDATERAWRDGDITTTHTSRFAANPVMEVASQPATERPTSTLMNSLFVIMLALPGLAMFYGGLSRAGSVNSALMSSALCMSVVSITWVAGAYSGTFSTTGMSEGTIDVRSFFGSFDKALLSGVTSSSVFRGLPELTWFLFQLKLAIIASTIAMGGLIERAKLSAKILMTSLWIPVVYMPVCHAVAAGPGSLLGDIGVLDFAEFLLLDTSLVAPIFHVMGMLVRQTVSNEIRAAKLWLCPGSLATHVAAGVSALAAAAAVGGGRQAAPGAHNSPMTAIGMILLWLGWLGQASGSAAIAGTSIAAVLVNTQMAAAAGGLTWLGFDMAAQQQSLLGLSCGVLAGLVAVTPAMAYVSVVGAMVMGLVASTVAWVFVTLLLSRGWYDDCVRLYGTTAAAGIAGATLTGVVTNPVYGGTGPAGPIFTQLVVQLLSVGAVVAWALVGTYIVAQVTAIFAGGLRVPEGEGGGDAVLKD